MSVQFQSTNPTHNRLKDLLHQGGREQTERAVGNALASAFNALENAPLSKDSLIISYRDPQTGKPTDRPVTDTVLTRGIQWLSELIHPNKAATTYTTDNPKGAGAPVA